MKYQISNQNKYHEISEIIKARFMKYQQSKSKYKMNQSFEHVHKQYEFNQIHKNIYYHARETK